MYESFFNLTGKPFQLNPDPGFLFASRGHKRAMAYLEYGLHQSEGFIVVTGEIGAGKTTLLRSLMERLDHDKVVAANLVSTQLDANDILRMVASSFGVPHRGLDKAGLLLALETFFVSLAASGKRALLIVDEAQNLSQQAVEELRMLSNFQLEDHALLQSFLVGQPEFRSIMQGPDMQQLRQRVIATYHLGPMDAEETRAYIEHRLTRVGWQSDPVFDSDAYEAIYRYTAGVPRRINSLCDRLLLAAYLGDSHRISGADARNVIAELNEEFRSPSAQPRSASAVSPPGETATIRGAGLPAVDATRLIVPGDLAERASQLAQDHDVKRLEARLVNIEQSLGQVLDVLSHLLNAVRQDEDRRKDEV